MAIPSNMCMNCGGEVKLFYGKDLRWACTGSCGRIVNTVRLDSSSVFRLKPEQDVDWDRITTDVGTVAAVIAATM